jgi:hypothetical protein
MAPNPSVRGRGDASMQRVIKISSPMHGDTCRMNAGMEFARLGRDTNKHNRLSSNLQEL